MAIPEPWVLSIDRTEWKFGSKIFNILTLGIVHQGVAFPLLWWMLDKKGNSNTQERVDLLSEFIELFREYKIAYLTADREFLGHDWLKYLLSQPMIPFRIRIRHSDCLSEGKHLLPASMVFSHLKISQAQVLRRRKYLWGHPVYVAALRLKDNSLLIVIASDSERLSRLFALLAIALCWAYRTGQWLSEHKPIMLKKHGRKAKSIFRYGFDYLRCILFNLEQYHTSFLCTLKFLSCT